MLNKTVSAFSQNRIVSVIERHSTLALAGVISCFMSAILIGTNFLRMPLWSDENHYIETVRLFVHSFTLSTIHNYKEMHTPLAYMLYALVGKCFGDEIWIYRLFTMACASITLVSIYFIMRRITGRAIVAIVVVALFIVNPYVYGLSVFIFSDMTGVMFLFLAFAAGIEKRTWLFCITSAAAILCRQYNAFLPAAFTLWVLFVPQVFSKKEKIKFLCAAILSLVPVIALFLFWGDIAPPRGMAFWNPHREQGFHPAYIVAYCTLFTVYAAPAIITIIPKFIAWKRIFIGIIISPLYIIWPIRPSPLAIEQANVHTVGFFHKALKFATCGNSLVEHTFFCCCFVVAIAVLHWLFSTTIAALKTMSRYAGFLLLLGIVVSLFLGLMAMSFFMWEKYLVPIMPFLIGWILLARQQERDHPKGVASD